MIDALRMLGLSRRVITQTSVIVADSTPVGRNGVSADPEPAVVSLQTTLKGIYRMLGLLSVIAVLAMLYFGRDVFIPIALALTLGLLMRPPVRWLCRRRVPEFVGAFLCLAAAVIIIAAGIVPLINPAQEWVNDLPKNLSLARDKLHVVREHAAQWGRFRSQIAELATTGDEEPLPVPVTVREPEMTSNAEVLSMTGGVIGMWLVIVVLTYFLLISGDSLLNSVLSMLPTFREKRRTVELIKEVERSVSSYLATVTVINIGLGIVVGLTLWVMGVPNPAVWGLMTTVFNYVPFIGQGVAGLVIGLVSLLHFDSFGYALLAPVAFYCIAAVEGNLITPSLIGRHMSLNPALVLISLIGWGWMWGISGAALAIPILAVLKIGCAHFGMTGPSTAQLET
jgi:predicted PurR-regulated permease PerM